MELITQFFVLEQIEATSHDMYGRPRLALDNT